MKIAITGASSGIGSFLASHLGKKGHEIIVLSRNPKNEYEKFFDIDCPRPFYLECDLFIHIAWKYADSNDKSYQNLMATKEILRMLPETTKVIFLSTLSAYLPNSNYGREKSEIERLILGRHGLVLRAGLLWGGESNFGILKVIGKFIKVPFFCFHLKPNPHLFTTHLEEVLAIIEKMILNFQSALVVIGNKNYLTLSDICHSVQQKPKIHISLKIKHLELFGKACNAIRVRIPFRFDSLNGLLNNHTNKILEQIRDGQNHSHSNEEFKLWFAEKIRLEIRSK